MRFASVLVFGAAVVTSAVIASGCAPAARRSEPPQPSPGTPAASSLPASFDGIAFIHDGRLFRVSGGVASEVARDGRRKVAVSSAGGPRALLVTEEHDDGVDVMLVTGSGTESMRKLLAVADGSSLLGVRVSASGKKVYRAVQGDPSASLAVTRVGRDSVVTTIGLTGGFSGEFDLGSDGAIVYTSATQDPARLFLARGSHSKVMSSSLATIFAPSIHSGTGAVCFTGSARNGEPIALWVLDRGTKKPRRLTATAGLVPTHAVFSGDGSWIAFRSGANESLYAIRNDGTHLRMTPLKADDVPIAW